MAGVSFSGVSYGGAAASTAVNAVVLGVSGAPVQTSALTDTALATIAVPANTIGPNGCLRISFRFGIPNNANNKTMSVSFGGVQLFGRTRTTTTSESGMILLLNRNNAASQVELTSMSAASAVFQASSTAVLSTYTIDTTASQNVVFSGNVAVGTDYTRLESYLVEYMYGA